MTAPSLRTGLQLRSLVLPQGELELSLVSDTIADLAPDDVVVRIEAAPVNPSDIGLLFGAADMRTARATGTAAQPVVTATIAEKSMPGMAARLGQSMPVGNEGAGVVVDAGSSDAARAAGQNSGGAGWCHVCPAALRQGQPVSGIAGGHHAG